MGYLVDCGVMVDFTRGKAKAADYLHSLGDDCRLPAITALELIADILISGYEQIPPAGDVTGRPYYLIKTHAKSAGLGTLDALIAATRIENGFALVSKNRKAFPNDRRAGSGSSKLLRGIWWAL